MHVSTEFQNAQSKNLQKRVDNSTLKVEYFNTPLSN